jgi:hypothetical protein
VYVEEEDIQDEPEEEINNVEGAHAPLIFIIFIIFLINICPTHSAHRSGAEGAPAAGQGRKEVPGLPHAAQQDVHAATHGTPSSPSPSLAL